MNRTETAVHDPASARAQRKREARRENELTLSLAMGAQVFAYGALYVLPAASTAAWAAVLLLLIPLALMRLLAAWVGRAALPGAENTLPFRLAAGGMAALFLTNMAVCLLTLTELAQAFFFPGGSRLWLALAAALALGLGMPASFSAAPNLSRFLTGFLVLALGFCALTVLSEGESGYLYPLAGYGAGHTLHVALRASGSVWMAGALAVLSPGDSAKGGLRAALPGARAVALVALLLLCCAYVLPGTQLSFRRGYALRLQLLMELSPNTLSWSLALMAEMLMFLAGFALCSDLMRKCLKSALHIKRLPLLPFSLACMPLAVQGMGVWEQRLIRLLPWRYPLAAALLLMCLLSSHAAKKKGKSP